MKLNVPDAAATRRLRCPRCATKFAADGRVIETKFDAAGASSEHPGRSSITLPISNSSSSTGDFGPALPTVPVGASGTFELPFPTATGEIPTVRALAPASFADPEAFFRDDPIDHRRPLAGDARQRARRCPTCGSHIARGMSLCGTCGLDLDTGTRVEVGLQILDEPPPPTRPSAPVGIVAVGVCGIALSTLMAIFALIQYQKGGVLYLLVLAVCLFGVFGAVQMLRFKSLRPFFLALALGTVVDVIALIFVPIYVATKEAASVTVSADNPLAMPAVEDRLDMTKMAFGVAMFVLAAGVAIYLNSPGVRRSYRR